MTQYPNSTEEPALTDPSPQPTPVLDSSKWSGYISGAFVAVSALVFWFKDGGFTSANVEKTGNLIGLAVAAVLALAAYGHAVFQGKQAARQVTPVSSPRDNQGNPLVPAQDLTGRHAALTPAFPDAEWDAWLEHPRSDGRTQALVAAMNLYRARTSGRAE